MKAINQTEKIKKQIGENIKKIRLNSSLEVKKVCTELKISPAAYSNIERGLTDISISRIIQFADYFGVHFSSILAIDNVTNYNFTPHNNSTGTQNNSQITHQLADGLKIALEQVKDENTFLRKQNESLTKMLDKKK